MQENEERISLRGVGIKIRREDEKEILFLVQRSGKKAFMANLISKPGLRWGLHEISQLTIERAAGISAP
jgi:hypothetical protein